jgi:hypothetical protein
MLRSFLLLCAFFAATSGFASPQDNVRVEPADLQPPSVTIYGHGEV